MSLLTLTMGTPASPPILQQLLTDWVWPGRWVSVHEQGSAGRSGEKDPEKCTHRSHDYAKSGRSFCLSLSLYLLGVPLSSLCAEPCVHREGASLPRG